MWNSTSINMTNVPGKCNMNYQPGGVATIIHGKMVGRIKAKTKDEYGRWTCTYMLRSENPPLCIINAYMPCMQSCPGILTYTHQLYQVLEVDSPTKVREKSWIDLQVFIKAQQSEGMEIILGMDANADPNKEGGVIQNIKEECNLVDATLYINPDQRDTPTYSRGRWRLDMFLISENLKNAIKNV